jgi:hypothetical protein
LKVDTSSAENFIPIDNEDEFKNLEIELGSNNAMAKQLVGNMYKTMKEDKKIKLDEKGNFYSRLIEKSFFTENCFRTQFTWKTNPNGTKSKKASVEDKQSPIQRPCFCFRQN